MESSSPGRLLLITNDVILSFFCLILSAEVFVRLGQWCLVLSGLWNDWQHAPRSLERDL